MFKQKSDNREGYKIVSLSISRVFLEFFTSYPKLLTINGLTYGTFLTADFMGI